MPLPSLAAVEAEIRRREIEAERERVRQNVDAIRSRCKTLIGFVKEAWAVLHPDTPLVMGWHIEAICDHLEAVTRGDITRLLINVPPATMKSLLCSVFWPAWEWTFSPSKQYLTTSWSMEYVSRDCRKMLNLVQSEWYQQVWGDQFKLTNDAETEFHNDKFGFRWGRPFEGLTGGRGDRLVIDDPHSVAQADSDTLRERTVRTFREAVPYRLNSQVASAIVIIMQRLHREDVSAQAIALRLGYVHLMLPMEFEIERRCITYVKGNEFFRDPRTYDGEVLLPERFPKEALDRDKRSMTQYAIAGQLQQRPAPREGGIFKRHWFERVPVAPAERTSCRGWDLAASDVRGSGKNKSVASVSSAWTVGVKLSVTPKGVYYIEDVRREQASPADVEKMIETAAKDDGPRCRISIPQDPGQAGVAQILQFAKLLAGYDVRFSPESGSKEVRALPVAAQAEVGNVKIVDGPWVDTFLEEICTFPASTAKDQVDALSRAFGELLVNVPGWGVLEFYRLQSAQQTIDAEKIKAAQGMPIIATGGVRMKAPAGISTAYGLTGRQYNADPEGFIIASADDAGPLRAAGFVDQPVSTSNAEDDPAQQAGAEVPA